MPVVAETSIVEVFTPQGEAKAVRQAMAWFAEPMVALGDPRLLDPFNIECLEKGRGRWIDSRNWSFDFDRDLPAGIRCTFRLKRDLRTAAGRTVSDDGVFSFSTGGQAIRESRPWESSVEINEKQVFVLHLDAEPEAASLVEHAYFVVSGIGERVFIRLLAGEERKKILMAVRDRIQDGSVAVLQARQIFPPQADVRLVWGKGVRSLTGVATTEDQVLVFRVREPFRAELSCSRERADAACIPVLPLDLSFTARPPYFG
jgi:hypothetical protein